MFFLLLLLLLLLSPLSLLVRRQRQDGLTAGSGQLPGRPAACMCMAGTPTRETDSRQAICDRVRRGTAAFQPKSCTAGGFVSAEAARRMCAATGADGCRQAQRGAERHQKQKQSSADADADAERANDGGSGLCQRLDCTQPPCLRLWTRPAPSRLAVPAVPVVPAVGQPNPPSPHESPSPPHHLIHPVQPHPKAYIHDPPPPRSPLRAAPHLLSLSPPKVRAAPGPPRPAAESPPHAPQEPELHCSPHALAPSPGRWHKATTSIHPSRRCPVAADFIVRTAESGWSPSRQPPGLLSRRPTTAGRLSTVLVRSDHRRAFRSSPSRTSLRLPLAVCLHHRLQSTAAASHVYSVPCDCHLMRH